MWYFCNFPPLNSRKTAESVSLQRGPSPFFSSVKQQIAFSIHQAFDKVVLFLFPMEAAGTNSSASERARSGIRLLKLQWGRDWVRKESSHCFQLAPGTGPRKLWCYAYVNELKEAELLVLHTLIQYPSFARPLHCTGLDQSWVWLHFCQARAQYWVFTLTLFARYGCADDTDVRTGLLKEKSSEQKKHGFNKLVLLEACSLHSLFWAATMFLVWFKMC